MVHVKVSEIILGVLCIILLCALMLSCHQLIKVSERSMAYEAGYVRARAKVEGYRELFDDRHACNALRREMLKTPPGPEPYVQKFRGSAKIAEPVEDPMPSLTPEATPSSERVLPARTTQRGPTP